MKGGGGGGGWGVGLGEVGQLRGRPWLQWDF